MALTCSVSHERASTQTEVADYTGQRSPSSAPRWVDGWASLWRIPFSDELTTAIDALGYAVGRVEWLDDKVILIEFGSGSPESSVEVRITVDTDLGFAVRSYERLLINPAAPHSGRRDLLEWDDFAQVGPDGRWLPRTHRHESFNYAADQGSPHTFTTLVEVDVSSVNDGVRLLTSSWLPPGAIVHLQKSVSDPDMVALQEASMRMWMSAEAFRAEPVPAFNEAASRPIGLPDLEYLRAKYGIE